MIKKILLVPILVLAMLVSIVHAENIHKPDNAAIPGQYIVVLNDDVADSASASDDLGRAYGLGISHRYDHALKGFAATIPEARLNALKKDARVAFVSEDRIVTADAKPVKEYLHLHLLLKPYLPELNVPALLQIQIKERVLVWP